MEKNFPREKPPGGGFWERLSCRLGKVGQGGATATPKTRIHRWASPSQPRFVALLHPAYSFRHRRRWNVPECGRPRLRHLLKQPYQFRLLGQESIVAMGARHLPVIGLDPCHTNCLSKLANLPGREEPV